MMSGKKQTRETGRVATEQKDRVRQKYLTRRHWLPMTFTAPNGFWVEPLSLH